METKKTNSWWTNFLTGVLATAIGVGLTFGVNNLVRHSTQKKAQRQAAMMAIYDIDDIIEKLTNEKKQEDFFFEIAMYLFNHQEKLESTAMDSLWAAINYLQYSPTNTAQWHDDSTEKVFTSSMDALMSIGDITFCDNVQECYRMRRDFIKALQENVNIRKPVSYEFVADFRRQCKNEDIDPMGEMTQPTSVKLLKRIFQQPEVTPYLQRYHSRNDNYESIIENLTLINQENKFLMNISEADMKRYIEDHISKTMPATNKRLVGTWENKRGNKTRTYELHKDHTASYTIQTELQLGFQLYNEGVQVSMVTPLAFSTEGEWNLQNDSLIIQLDSATTQLLTLNFDLSSFPKSYLEQYKDSLDLIQQDYREKVLGSIKQRFAIPEKDKVSIAKTGQIMFWEDQHTLPWGEIQTNKIQYIKIAR